MRRLFFSIILMGALVLVLLPVSYASPIVSCNNPVVNAPSGGGTVTINITCTMSNLAGINTLTNSSIVTPSSIVLSSGSNTLTATLQSTITSPDGTVTGISGLPILGFVGTLTDPTSTLQFQYKTTTTSSTPSGNYISNSGAMSFNWFILTVLGGSVTTSGTATSTLEVDVPAPPTTVSCASPSVNAPAGGGVFTMNVDCTISNSGSSISPSASNTFSPALLTLTSGSNTLSANLQSSISSPDASVTGITGTASGGFAGTIHTLPATIRAQYIGSSTSTTPSGTYNSGTITYIWSTL